MAYTTINKSSEHFSTNLWVADDTSPRSLTGFGHQPDFVWVKHRGSSSINHTLVDSVRGGDKMLASNTTASEDTKSHGEITSFNSDGITVADGTSGTYPRLYFNDLDPFGAGGGNYVGWSWKANGAGSANTDGSINTTSTSVNTTAGFSISKYTGTGSAGATVGHGLGVAPKMIIAKGLTYADVWIVGGDNLGGWNKEMYLNSISAVATNNNAFNGVAPTSSVFTLGSGNGTNKSGDTYIAYCFAEKQGYSKFGSYVGNGNADGTFVYTGFKPAFVMAKASSATGYWTMHDNKRTNSFNVVDGNLYAQINSSEDTGANAHMDFLSNGFKLRGDYAAQNGSGITNIFMAFAEAPLVGTNNVPCTAR